LTYKLKTSIILKTLIGHVNKKNTQLELMEKLISPKLIGNRLKLLRGKIRQREFSKKLGISLSAYQRYEHGDRLPTLDILYKISMACDVNLQWLIKGRGEKKREKDEFVVAIDNLDYIFERGSFDLIDFILEVLELAVKYSQLDINNTSSEQAHNEFKDFLNDILKLVPKALLTSYDSTIRERKLLDELESEKQDNPTKN